MLLAREAPIRIPPTRTWGQGARPPGTFYSPSGDHASHWVLLTLSLLSLPLVVPGERERVRVSLYFSFPLTFSFPW